MKGCIHTNFIVFHLFDDSGVLSTFINIYSLYSDSEWAASSSFSRGGNCLWRWQQVAHSSSRTAITGATFPTSYLDGITEYRSGKNATTRGALSGRDHYSKILDVSVMTLWRRRTCLFMCKMPYNHPSSRQNGSLNVTKMSVCVCVCVCVTRLFILPDLAAHRIFNPFNSGGHSYDSGV